MPSGIVKGRQGPPGLPYANADPFWPRLCLVIFLESFMNDTWRDHRNPGAQSHDRVWDGRATRPSELPHCQPPLFLSKTCGIHLPQSVGAAAPNEKLASVASPELSNPGNQKPGLRLLQPRERSRLASRTSSKPSTLGLGEQEARPGLGAPLRR